MMSKLTAILCSLLLVWAPVAAHAESPSLGKITELQSGEKAPFSGVLLSEEAAARLFGELKFSEKECQLRLEKELSINSLQLNSQLDALKLRFDVENTRTESLLLIKDERIKFLEKNWRPTPWYESGEFWFAMGLVGGVLVTVGAGYAIGQASQ